MHGAVAYWSWSVACTWHCPATVRLQEQSCVHEIAKHLVKSGLFKMPHFNGLKTSPQKWINEQRETRRMWLKMTVKVNKLLLIPAGLWWKRISSRGHILWCVRVYTNWLNEKGKRFSIDKCLFRLFKSPTSRGRYWKWTWSLGKGEDEFALLFAWSIQQWAWGTLCKAAWARTHGIQHPQAGALS